MYMIQFMRKFIYLFIITFFCFSESYAEKVTKINVDGNKRISDATIVLFADVSIDQDLAENDLNEILINLYDTNFFNDVSLLFEKNILSIKVSENPIIQSINIVGVKSKKYLDPLYEIISMKEKSSYVNDFVNSDLLKIRNSLKFAGFYFSKVEVDIKENTNNTIDLIYNINLGEKALINNINFTGNKIFKDKKLRNVIVSEEEKFWKIVSNKKYLNEKQINLDTRLLKNYYLNNGYYDVVIESSSASFVGADMFNLNFNINAGNKYFFNNFDLIIPSDYNKKNFQMIYDKFEKLKGKSYSFNRVKDILDEVDKIALSKQYEFINASLDETLISSNKIDFTVIINESKKFYVNRINIIGNDITNERAIRDMLIVDEGDPFNELLNNKSINNIKSSGLFGKVDFTVKNDEEKLKKNIDIKLVEQPTGEISAGAGFGTSGKSFTAGIKEKNFNGNGVGLDTNFTIGTNSIQGAINFQIPNYKYSDKSLNGDLSRTDADFLSTAGYKNKLNRASIGTSFEQRENFYFSPNIILEYEKLETSSTASSNLKKQEGDYYNINFEYGLFYDQRDQSYATTEGYYSSFRQEVPLYSNSYSLVNTYEYKVFNQISEEMIGSISFYAKAINSLGDKDIRVSERINLPGKRLRGFEAGKIGPKDKTDYVGGNYASAVTVATTLPTFLPDLQSIDFGLFIDAGNVWGVDYDSSLDNSSKIRSSTGFTIDWLTPIGPLNFVLSQPITKNSSDVTENFRFDLGTTF